MTLPLQPPMQSRLAAQAGSAARAERSIATAFFTSASAIEKRVTRAKAYLKRSHSLFDLDNSRQVGARLGSVHQTLYLLFNEGYHSLRADAPVRDELCHEAIRLAQLIAADNATRIPATDALLALMYFSLARLRPGSMKGVSSSPCGISTVPAGTSASSRWDSATLQILRLEAHSAISILRRRSQPNIAVPQVSPRRTGDVLSFTIFWPSRPHPRSSPLIMRSR